MQQLGPILQTAAAPHRVSVEGGVRGAKGGVGGRQQQSRGPVCHVHRPSAEQQGWSRDREGGEHGELIGRLSATAVSGSALDLIQE